MTCSVATDSRSQRLTELFALRNDLMHPKSVVPADPKSRRISRQVYETFNPEVAAKHLVNVAEAALDLMTQRSVDDADFTALSVFAARNLILRYGREAKDSLPSLTARPVESFEVQLMREERDAKTGRRVITLSPDPKEVLPKLDRQRGRTPRPKR
jgi:hypothetical protein